LLIVSVMANFSNPNYNFNDNIKAAANLKLDLSKISTSEQHEIFRKYQEGANVTEVGSFFGFLTMIGHFCRNSFFLHYNSDSEEKCVNLYSVVIGQSGTGKSNIIRVIKEAVVKVEEIFSYFYLKPVRIGMEEQETSSIISDLSLLGLRKHLASQNKILMYDEADNILQRYGVFGNENAKHAAAAALIMKAFDGIRDETRSTDSTSVTITRAKMSMLVTTVGAKYDKLLKCWAMFNGSLEGLHNRIIHQVLPPIKPMLNRHNENKLRVYENQKEKKNKQNVPSFAHIALITHLFGDVHYVWRKSEKDDTSLKHDTGSQNLQSTSDPQAQAAHCSAYNYTYNKMIDYMLKKPVNDQTDEEELQHEIIGTNTKAVIIIPRLCILFQIFNYAMDVLKKCGNGVVFDEGYLTSRKINESLIRNAAIIVNQILGFAPRSPHCPRMPMLFVEKSACVAACNYYDHLHNTAVTLFTLPKKSLSRCKLTRPLSSSHVPSTPEEAICLFPYNFFMSDALTATTLEQWQVKNSLFHNSDDSVKAALTNLINDGILISGDFPVHSKNSHHESMMKVPVPHDQRKRDEFETKLKQYNVKLSDYKNVYKTSAKPAKCRLSRETVYFYSQFADFVPEYSKYKTDMKETIEQLIKHGHITEIIVNNDIQYAVSSTSMHFRSLSIDKATYEQLKKELPPLLKRKNSAKSSGSQSDDTKTAFTQLLTTPAPSQSMTTSTPLSNKCSQQLPISGLPFYSQSPSSLSEMPNDIKRLFEMFLQSNINQFTTYPNSLSVRASQNQTSAATLSTNQSLRDRRDESLKRSTASLQSYIDLTGDSSHHSTTNASAGSVASSYKRSSSESIDSVRKPRKRAYRLCPPSSSLLSITTNRTSSENHQDMQADAIPGHSLRENLKKHKKVLSRGAQRTAGI
ncbi:unnamed protein product, partial [Didymodactylos carnosus]